MATLIKVGKMWYSDFRANGKRYHRALSPYKEEAAAKLKDLVDVYRTQKHGLIPNDMTWGFFKSRYMEYSRTNKNPQTHYRDTLAFRMVEEVYPIKHLREMTPDLMERLKELWLQRGVKKPSINRALSALKAAMRKAEDWKYRPFENWTRVHYLKTPKARLHWYTLEELKRLRDRCKGIWLTGFMLGWEAGLRPAEKLRLEWADVYWHSNKLHIREAKGEKERWVPMSKPLRSYLEALPKGSTFVLGDEKPNEKVWAAYWRKIVRSVRLKGSEYTLRHSFASHLAMAGVPLKKIAELMGNTVKVVEDHYAHLCPDSLISSIDSLPKIGHSGGSALMPGPLDQRGLDKTVQV